MSSLAERIRSYPDDAEIGFSPTQPESEARQNTWAYDVSDAGSEQVSEVVEALVDVAQQLRARYEGSGQSGQFYAWYDDQAGQLRCSLTSQALLPFRAGVRQLTRPESVIQRALADPSPGVISLDGADQAPSDWVEDPTVLDVWVASV